MEFCKQAQEEVKWNRNLIYPLRKKTSNLNEHEKSNLKDFFKKNPGIESAYNFKENLCDLLRKKAQTASSCSRLIKQLKEMVSSMKYNSPVEFRRLAKTISDWFAPIIRMWRFTQNNGITEGFHRKMKLIQRRAYGFRNFANYRLRVLVECSGAEMKDLRDY
jgi:Transposase and inactivated derivatives